MRRRAVWAILYAATAVACSDASTRSQIVVLLEAEPGVRARIDKLEVRVEGRAGLTDDKGVTRLDAPVEADWTAEKDDPVRVPIVPRNGDDSRVYMLEAQALDAAGKPIVTARLLSGFVPGEVRFVRLVLEDSCIAVTCEQSETCYGGGCADPTVDPSKFAADESQAPLATDVAKVAPMVVDAGSDTGTGDCGDAPAVGRSCTGLADTCGPNMDESCCTARCVPGGTFALGRKTGDPDDDACNAAFTCDADEVPGVTATVRAVWLDRFEVTVGRFRKFVEAGMPDPAAAAGKHGYIADEPGWDANWPVQSTASLLCDPTHQTWTATSGGNEEKALNCIDWYTAYAFCIWDGGFLPTEAEWELAASGGEERVFPWSNPAGSTAIDTGHAVYGVSSVAPVGSKSPKGDGKWEHADLAGNLYEWSLDWYEAPYPMSPCNDCSTLLVTASNRILRGGSIDGSATALRATDRVYFLEPIGTRINVGVRCARARPAGESGMRGSDALPGGTDSCPTGLEGPVLVNVPAPAGSPVSSYCMDATEVTNAQYAAFLAASSPTSGQDSWCAWNTSYTPSSGWPAAGKDDYPVVYVDWCDAFAYCKWAGKHLCGKIGGGANAYGDYADAAKSEWYNACSMGGALTYAYGDTYSGTACNDVDNVGSATVPVGSMATCEGGYGGLYDLNGNVEEWEDSCTGTTGIGDACPTRGGSFYDRGSEDVRCDRGVLGNRDNAYVFIGFRCCSASP